MGKHAACMNPTVMMLEAATASSKDFSTPEDWTKMRLVPEYGQTEAYIFAKVNLRIKSSQLTAPASFQLYFSAVIPMGHVQL